jgi:hypothetical protein
MRRIIPALVLAAACLLQGCVFGNTQTFNYVPTDKSDAGKGSVVLLFAVDDQRPYIVTGEEPINFVGEQRNGYGMPFNVTTTDGRPFAQVVQETVQRDLEAAGFKVTPSADKAADIAAMERIAQAHRALAIVMHEFKSDTFNNINFDYDFEVIVYDDAGKELMRDRIAAEEELPGSLMNPAKAARQKVPPYFYAKIHGLVTGNFKVMKALTE